MLAILLGLLLACIPGWTQAQEQPGPLAVTAGLIRWWPNLFDARDEVTGQEGQVMGVLPAIEPGMTGETTFSAGTGWLLLRPALTNGVFTTSFWIRPTGYTTERLLAQHGASAVWGLQIVHDPTRLSFTRDALDLSDPGETVPMQHNVWQHIAIARRPDATSLVWLNGNRALNGSQPHAWPGDSHWLTVGALESGGHPFHGSMRDLCVYDRVLDDREVRSIYEAGLPQRPSKNSLARRNSTQRALSVDVSTNVVFPSPRRWNHRRFTTEDGLPGNGVHALLETRDGYLWVGTDSGLARFDGRGFRPFTRENTPALAAIGQNVTSLAEADDGTIWAGIFGGLLRIRGVEFTAFTINLPQRFILQVLPAGDGSVWVAGFNDFLPRGPCRIRRYDPVTMLSYAETVVPGHLRRWVAATNGIWLATEHPEYLLYWDGRSPAPKIVGKIGTRPLDLVLAEGHGLPKDSLVRAWTNGANAWLEARLGEAGPAFSWHWNPRGVHAGRWEGPAVTTDNWLGVSYELAREQGGNLEQVVLPEQVGGGEIGCLSPADEGGVWFGTEEDGLHHVEERLIQVFTREDGLAGNNVRTITTAPDGSLWAATSDGLSHWLGGRWTPGPKGRMRSVAVDGKGEPWFGNAAEGPHGVGRGSQPSPQSTILFEGIDWQHPTSLHFDRSGSLWITCARGLSWIRPQGLARHPVWEHWTDDPSNPESSIGRFPVNAGPLSTEPLGLVEDREGVIWTGSLGAGLFQTTRTNQTLNAFTEKSGLPSNYCVPLYCDRSNVLWMSTLRGLTRHSNGRFETVGTDAGLPKDTLLDLIEDDFGHFWISGRRGIYRVSRTSIEDVFEGRSARIQSLNLGVKDGMLTPECSIGHYPSLAKTPDGRIWVATRNGLATLDPTRVRINTKPLVALVERVLANGREFKLPRSTGASPEPLSLPPGSGRRLELHFTVVSLTDADRVRFRHRLDGNDADWSTESDQRLAFYTNLQPGPHRFRVKAANAHHVWSEQETMMDIVILPHYWQTTAFYWGLGLGIAALALLLHRGVLMAQQRLQEVNHQEALLTEKSRIAADMHDELGSALTQIVILGEVAKSHAHNPARTLSALHRMSQSAREVTAALSEIVWATNPRNDTLENLVGHLREHAAMRLHEGGIHASLNFPTKVPNGQVSAIFRRNLSLILRESLQNILKHAQTARVKVSLDIIESTLTLRIADEGIGFPCGGPVDGNGLHNMRRRAEELGGRFKVGSEQRVGGVVVEVAVPLPRTAIR